MGFRRSVRALPNALQAGIGATTVINQSRIVFSGSPGLVFCLWKVHVVNAGAVAVPNVTLGFAASFAGVPGASGSGWFEATAGLVNGLWAMAMIVDPPEGAFIEATITTTAGTVDVIANNSVVMVLSLESGAGGPVATLAA